ncbi:MAG TPA: hypothetical protein VG096_13365 [Bryobacteraceae bacterium]|nr:hypothetical protein [Bryobacteraceae bacterium]
MRPADTSPEAWRALIELIRKMPAEERLQRAMELSETVRLAAEDGLRRAHPEASEREIFLLVARQKLGDELCRRVYGPA